MKRIFAITIVLLLCLSAGFAQDWAKQKLDKSPRHSEWVTLKHDNRSVQAFVVYPETKKKVPVIIVIHEIFGLSDWAKTVADDLAAQGYIAIAPDLLSGAGPKGGGSSEFASTQDAVKAVSGLNADQVTADLNAAADYAKKIPAGQRQNCRERLLLGWRTVVPLCHQSQRPERRVRLLWPWAGECCRYHGAGLWLLCR